VADREAGERGKRDLAIGQASSTVAYRQGVVPGEADEAAGRKRGPEQEVAQRDRLQRYHDLAHAVALQRAMDEKRREREGRDRDPGMKVPELG
jgi:hypothetical protein